MTNLRTVQFVEAVNDNLICCICQAPFIDPVISTCGHTFCKECIEQSLEISPLCPIDRATLSIDDIKPATKIINNMVNELVVYCPRLEQGCNYIGQRQFIESHLRNDCECTLAPCELDECKELLLKKDLEKHAETCKFKQVECTMCKKKCFAFELEDHHKQCPAEIIECLYCEASYSRAEHTTHINACPQFIVTCTYDKFGCTWKQQRQELSNHLLHCPYESLKEYIFQQEKTEKDLRKEIQQLHKENESLQRRGNETQQQVETLTRQLSLMHPTHFSMGSMPSSSHVAESQRINNELETLSANIVSLELKQNMALMTETFRLQEELQSLRAICHGLRLQMHHVMIDRRATTTPRNTENIRFDNSRQDTKL